MKQKTNKEKRRNRKKLIIFFLTIFLLGLFGLFAYIFGELGPTGLSTIELTNLNVSETSVSEDNPEEITGQGISQTTGTEINSSQSEETKNKKSKGGSGQILSKMNQGQTKTKKPKKEKENLIQIISPSKNSGSNGTLIVEYNLTNEENISNCSLFLDGKKVTENNLSTEPSRFYIENLGPQKYYYHIVCEDTQGNLTSSDYRNVHVVKANGFKGMKLDFEGINIESLLNFTLEIPSIATIKFLDTINLSGGADINKYVKIKHNFVSINSSFLPQLNKRAIISLYNLNFSKEPIIKRDGEVCETCEIISYQEGLLIFSVDKFSSYVAGINSQMEIWDDSDNGIKDAYENHRFYANYTTIVAGAPILNAECNMSIAGVGDYNLSYDAGLLLYTTTVIFTSKGTYDFNIECSEPSYEWLNTSDQALVNNQWISVRNSTRPSDPIPSTLVVQAKNVTTLLIDETTQTQFWAAFYGNVSGTIVLGDSENNRFYSWNTTNPLGEIYAARGEIGFQGLRCANETNIADEELSLGMTETEQGINDTFTVPNHRSFSVSDEVIVQDSCNTSHPFVNQQSQSNYFANVLLFDETNNLTIYTALMETNQQGYTGQIADFQMLVAENGQERPIITTTYFFYVELA